MKKIFYKILDNGTEFYNLKKKTSDSAGFDLIAAIQKKIILKPNATTLIPTGFSTAITKRFEAQVRPRSGIGFEEFYNCFKLTWNN